MAQFSPKYSVVGDNGHLYGPADLAVIQQWASSNAVHPTSVVIEEGTGRKYRAEDIPELRQIFASRAPMQGFGQPGGVSAYSPGGGAVVQVVNQTHVPIPQPTNGSAVASLVLGILGLVLVCVPCAGPILGLIGLVLGIVAFTSPHSRGVAIAGTICSAIALLVWVAWFFFFAAAAASAHP